MKNPKYSDFKNLIMSLGLHTYSETASIGSYKSYYNLAHNSGFSGKIIYSKDMFNDVVLLFDLNEDYMGYCNMNANSFTQEEICTAFY